MINLWNDIDLKGEVLPREPVISAIRSTAVTTPSTALQQKAIYTLCAAWYSISLSYKLQTRNRRSPFYKEAPPVISVNRRSMFHPRIFQERIQVEISLFPSGLSPDDAQRIYRLGLSLGNRASEKSRRKERV